MKYWGIIGVVSVVVLSSVFVLTVPVLAQETGFAEGLARAGFMSGLGVTAFFPLKALLLIFMRWLLSLVAIFAIIAFVISGFMYLTSAGDEDQAKTAKKAFTYALIGLIVSISGLVVITAVTRWMTGHSIF